MSTARRPNQYTGVRPINPPNIVYANRAPISTDVAYVKGDFWLDQTNEASYQYNGGGSWISLGTGTTGGVNTLTGGSGGAITPTGGTVSMLGTANQLTSTGSAGGHSITYSIPTTFVAPGTIASTTTITAGSTLVATTSVTAGTSVTATLGNITATNGNFVKGSAANKDVYTSLATTTTAGANAAGTVTLVGGTATISTTSVTASSKIRHYRQSIGATGAAATGNISIGTITAGTSFVINSVSAADATALAASDVSVVFWEIVN